MQNEPFSETKKRLEQRTGFKGKMLEKIKFAVVRRSHYSKPQYLSDGMSTHHLPTLPSVQAGGMLTGFADDVLWNVASSDDDMLGLDHVDRTRVARNGTDLFLK